MCLRFVLKESKQRESLKSQISETPKKVYGGSTGKYQGIQMSEDRRTIFKGLRNPLRGWSFFHEQKKQVRDP